MNTTETTETTEPIESTPEAESTPAAPVKPFTFTVAVRDLKEAVVELRKLAKKTTLPVLETVLVERDKGETRFTATDLDARLTYAIPSDLPEPTSELGKKLQANRSEREDGALCVPIKDLAFAAKNADANGEIIFESSSLSYTLNGNKATLGGFEIQPVEFPTPRTDFGELWPLSNTARDGILTAMQCASEDETRYVLVGVYLEGANNLIIATDGKQLLQVEAPLQNGIGEMIMPSNSLRLLTGRIAKLPWLIAVSSTQLKIAENSETPRPSSFQITAGRWTMQSRAVEGNYPNWRQVCPEKDDEKAAIYRINTYNRLMASDLLKRLPKNTADTFNAIKVTVGAGDVIRFSLNKDNSFEVTLSSGAGNKPRHTHGNRNFWQRLIDLGCTEIRIQDEMSPVVGYKDNMSYVFMPVRPSS